MHVHFLFTVPVWLELILLIIKIVAAGSASKASMVRRQITAPDGRKAIFVVPADEPPSVSIARMYPGGVIPAEAAQGTAQKVANQSRPWLAALSSEPQAQRMSPVQFWFCVGLAAFVMVAFTFGIVDSQSGNGSGVTAPSYQTASESPAPVQALAPVLPRVQLKTGANVRNGPSRSAAVLRVGQQAEVFTKFGEANGWLHVGAAQPEGWVAQSVVTSVP